MARIRRGTYAQMSAGTLYRDDIYLCTDSHQVYLKQGTDAIPVGNAMMGVTDDRPDAGIQGRFYYDTTIGALFFDDGSAWQNASVVASELVIHAAQHIRGAADEVDGDKLDIDWNPSNSTPASVSNYSTSVDELTSHLKGIDVVFGLLPTTYANIDGDILDIDWNPSNSTPTTVEGVASGGDMLTSHLKGIDLKLADKLEASDIADKADAFESTSTIADLGVTVPSSPAWSGVLSGLTGTTTIVNLLTAVDEATEDVTFFTAATKLSEIAIVPPVDGSGCTLDTTVVDGAINNADLNAAGTGYQVGDVLAVAGGSGGQITVATLSGSGVATFTISAPGTGYTSGTGVATTTTSTRTWAGALTGLTANSTLQALLNAIDTATRS